MERYAITDEQWERIQQWFPAERSAKRGRPWRNHRLIVSAILWVVCSGAKWRDVPRSYGPWKTVYNRFRRWYFEGLWARLWEQLLVDLDQQGEIDWNLWCRGRHGDPCSSLCCWRDNDGPAGTGRPCFGAFPGGFWHQTACGG